MDKNLEEDAYVFQPWPWCSKSTIISEKFCPWLFKLRYLDKIDTGVSLKAETGTNMHATVALFFDRFKMEDLIKIPINYEEDLTNSRVYHFIKAEVNKLIPYESREYNAYKIILRNFALMEAAHWISLNEEYKGNTTRVIKYFIPAYLEKYIEFPEAKLFGTIDRKNRNKENGVELHEIYDYKMGHVPKDIQRGLRDPYDEYSWKMKTNNMFQLHFYMMLDLLIRGFSVNEKLVEYLTNPKYYTKNSRVPRVDSVFYNSAGEPYDYQKYYRIGIIYLGNEQGPFVPKKIPNPRSLRAVFRNINRLRGKVYRKEPFLKEISYWKCKNCTITKRCLNEEEEELLHLPD